MTCMKSLSIRVQSALSAASKVWQKEVKTTEEQKKIKQSAQKTSFDFVFPVSLHMNQLRERTNLFKTVHVPLLCIHVKQRDIRVRAWVNPCTFHHSQDVPGTLNVPKMAVFFETINYLITLKRTLNPRCCKNNSSDVTQHVHGRSPESWKQPPLWANLCFSWNLIWYWKGKKMFQK